MFCNGRGLDTKILINLCIFVCQFIVDIHIISGNIVIHKFKQLCHGIEILHLNLIAVLNIVKTRFQFAVDVCKFRTRHTLTVYNKFYRCLKFLQLFNRHMRRFTHAGFLHRNNIILFNPRIQIGLSAV